MRELLNISYEEYEALPGLRASDLKKAQQSMLAYKWHMDHKHDDDDDDKTESPSLRIGSALHCAILEPEDYSSRYGVYEGIRRGKEWDSFKANHPGMTMLSKGEAKKIDHMRKAYLANQLMVDMIRPSLTEVSVQFEIAGRACKARFDALDTGSAADSIPARIIDVKSASDVSKPGFQVDAKKYGYPLQAGFYFLAAMSLGVKPEAFLFACLQNCPPHETAIYSITLAEMLEQARNVEALVIRISDCERRNEWPGASSQPIQSLM